MAAGMSHDVSDDARGEGPWRQAGGEVDPEHCSAECLDLMRVSELSVLSEFALCSRGKRESMYGENSRRRRVTVLDRFEVTMTARGQT